MSTEPKTRSHENACSRTQSAEGIQQRSAEKGVSKKIPSKSNDRAYEPILTRSNVLDEDSLDSFGESTESSEELDIIESEENRRNIEQKNVEMLSRMGFRKPLWTNKFSSFFVIISFILNYDSLVQFPLLFDIYGINFLIAYLVCMCLIGFPLVYMELALGQYTSSNVIAVFEKMTPAFAGVGFAATILHFISFIHDQYILLFILFAFGSSANLFSIELPWHNCASAENGPGCHTQRHSCGGRISELGGSYEEKWLQGTGRKEIFKSTHRTVLERAGGDACLSSSLPVFDSNAQEKSYTNWFRNDPIGQRFFPMLNFENFEMWAWPSFTALIAFTVAWLLVILLDRLGRTKIVMICKAAITLLLSTVFVCIMLIVVLRPPDYVHISALEAMFSDSSHDFSMTWIMWGRTVAHVLQCLKLGQGRLIFIGSQNNFRNNITIDSFVLIMFMIFVPFLYSIFYLITLDSFVLELVKGDMNSWNVFSESAYKSTAMKANLVPLHLALFFKFLQVYNVYEPFILVVFTLMFSLLILGAKVVQMDFFVSTLTERFAITATERGRNFLAFSVVGLASIFQCLLFCGWGTVILMSLENIYFPLVTIIVVGFEIFLVVFFYGPRRLIANMTAMNKEHRGTTDFLQKVFNLLTIVFWTVVTPIGLALAIGWWSYLEKPWNSLGIALPYVVLSLSPIPVVLVYRVLESWHNRRDLRLLFRPDELWGPRSLNDREAGLYAERQIPSMC